ncbi:leucine-rich repeat domain-containing protein [Formosa sp. 3Alg 14/1]|uniref:leucine-rich repeat domain-containing protein n=1 Tax=Formosa sp. 3Alg 14/1 TaxID=3382190 RepID=UPI0039BE04C0
MKRKLLSLCFFSMTLFGFSQTTTIPDSKFEQALIDLGLDDVLDGSVLTANINTITVLEVVDKGIEDVTGLEDFVALEKLELGLNKLTTLDISKNTALTSLFVDDNQLTSLDVSTNTALKRFGIMRNNFTFIDVSALVNIEELFINENQITSVIFPENSPMWKIYMEHNQFTTVDVSRLTNLQELRAYSNQLTSLDVSGLTNLKELFVYNNQLASLDLSELVNIELLLIHQNELTSVIFPENSPLTELHIYENKLTKLDLSPLTKLVGLRAYNNQLASLDISMLKELSNFSANINQLKSLNMANGNNVNFTYFNASDNPDLQCIQVDDVSYATSNWTSVDDASVYGLDCFNTLIPDPKFEQALIDLGLDYVLDGAVATTHINSITSLVVDNKEISDLTGIEDFVALEELGLSYNKLTSLDVSNNIALTSLFVNDNELTAIDVSNNTALKRFGIMRNSFTTLDVSALVNIEELFIHQNELTSISFPENSPLWELHMYSNKFTTLDLSPLTKLVGLRAYNNQLSSLDVSMLANLSNISVNDNLLLSLNVANGNNANFTYFDATNNPDLQCIQVDDVNYATGNWTSVDDASVYDLDCFNTLIPDPKFEQALIDLGLDYVLDGAVATTHINSITSLVVDNKEISDLTGIEDFVALEELGLSYNKLTSLDVSNNIALTSLFVNDNELTAIDVSNNTALKRFGIMRNSFTTLDVSALVNIEELFLHQNQLTTVNLPSSAPSLWKLEIYENQMTDIDVSRFGNLRDLRVNQNQLTSLNLKNGNNANFTFFNSEYNLDLTCIFVDDSNWSNDNWSVYKDAMSTFVSNEADCNALSIEDVVTSKSQVYYNRGLGSITIVSPLQINAVRLYTLSGKELKSYHANPETISVNNLSTGMYIVHIDSEKGRETKKLIKY